MKLLINFVILLFYSNTLLANITNEIIKKLDETNNITFEFEQISNDQNENGKCLLVFPGKLKCIYNSEDGKEILVTNKSLYIIKHKFKRSYRACSVDQGSGPCWLTGRLRRAPRRGAGSRRPRRAPSCGGAPLEAAVV